MAVHEGLTRKVEQPNIIAKKCKIEISGKRIFDEGPKWGLERRWQVRKIKLFTELRRKLRMKNIVIKNKKSNSAGMIFEPGKS